MIERLRSVLERAERLPDADQERIAQQMEDALDELEWDELTQRPGAKVFHDELRAELRKAEAGGELDEITGDRFG